MGDDDTVPENVASKLDSITADDLKVTQIVTAIFITTKARLLCKQVSYIRSGYFYGKFCSIFYGYPKLAPANHLMMQSGCSEH